MKFKRLLGICKTQRKQFGFEEPGRECETARECPAAMVRRFDRPNFPYYLSIRLPIPFLT
jgi:hypothetical protein